MKPSAHTQRNATTESFRRVEHWSPNIIKNTSIILQDVNAIIVAAAVDIQ